MNDNDKDKFHIQLDSQKDKDSNPQSVAPQPTKASKPVKKKKHSIRKILPLMDSSSKMNKELGQLKKSFQYLQAEFATYKRTSTNETSKAYQYALVHFVEKLLTDVLNDFNYAMEKEVKEENVDEFKKGIEMIHGKFLNLLKKFDVEEIDPQKGDELNPHLHDVINQSPSEDIPKGHILYVCRKGYKLKDQLIQAAQVTASSGVDEEPSK